MATYYVRPDGNNANTGTGPTVGQAWQTLARIVQAGTAFTSGDTVYIAPGTYRQSITTTATYTSATNFFGDPTAAQFPGMTPGMVRITNRLINDNSAATSQQLWGGVTFDYINISNIYFDHSSTKGGIYYSGSGNNSSIKNCIFFGNSETGGGVGGPPIWLISVKNVLIENCIVNRAYVAMYISTTTDTNTNVVVRNCYINNTGSYGIWTNTGVGGGLIMTNLLLSGTTGNAVYFQGTGNITSKSYITNSIFHICAGSVQGASATNIVEDYNRRINSGGNTTVPTGTNTVTDGATQYDFGHTSLFGLAVQKPFSSIIGSVNSGTGLATYASTSDLYGQTWSGGAGVPDIGAATAVQASGTSYYYPTERNASVVTIAPASTSQSIELYLGATGLTFATSGLAAYYVRNQSAPVAITLVTQTPTGAWTSGGFAEISSSLVPGVYRLDVPNAAFAAGASDVTIVVRGASGTNGAVLTVTLSSGGLTAAQTAAAVWDEARASHTTAGTFGQYVNAELVTPVTSAALVRMGPFEVRADGLGASDPLDIQKGAQHGIDIQCVDNNGAGIDITSATVTAKVYNSGATLVSTLACTATYAADGRATFTLTTTVTNTPGTYTATITRTTGASDTQIFGPLRIYVRDI